MKTKIPDAITYAGFVDSKSPLIFHQEKVAREICFQGQYISLWNGDELWRWSDAAPDLRCSTHRDITAAITPPARVAWYSEQNNTFFFY